MSTTWITALCKPLGAVVSVSLDYSPQTLSLEPRRWLIEKHAPRQSQSPREQGSGDRWPRTCSRGCGWEGAEDRARTQPHCRLAGLEKTPVGFDCRGPFHTTGLGVKGSRQDPRVLERRAIQFCRSTGSRGAAWSPAPRPVQAAAAGTRDDVSAAATKSRAGCELAPRHPGPSRPRPATGRWHSPAEMHPRGSGAHTELNREWTASRSPAERPRHPAGPAERPRMCRGRPPGRRGMSAPHRRLSPRVQRGRVGPGTAESSYFSFRGYFSSRQRSVRHVQN